MIAKNKNIVSHEEFNKEIQDKKDMMGIEPSSQKETFVNLMRTKYKLEIVLDEKKRMRNNITTDVNKTKAKIKRLDESIKDLFFKLDINTW